MHPVSSVRRKVPALARMSKVVNDPVKFNTGNASHLGSVLEGKSNNEGMGGESDLDNCINGSTKRSRFSFVRTFT